MYSLLFYFIFFAFLVKNSRSFDRFSVYTFWLTGDRTPRGPFDVAIFAWLTTAPSIHARTHHPKTRHITISPHLFPLFLKTRKFRISFFFLSTFCWFVTDAAVYKPCTRLTKLFPLYSELSLFFPLILFISWSFLWRNLVPCPNREITACLWAKTHGAEEGAKGGKLHAASLTGK